MLTIVEKVIFLQEIDIFEQTTTESLSHVAAIAEEVAFEEESVIYTQGEAADSLYLVLDGEVRLHRGGQEIMTAKKSDVIGSWALFDDEPRAMTATAISESRLLRIEKDAFYDLLADHTQITRGVFKALSRKAKTLLALVRE